MKGACSGLLLNMLQPKKLLAPSFEGGNGRPPYSEASSIGFLFGSVTRPAPATLPFSSSWGEIVARSAFCRVIESLRTDFDADFFLDCCSGSLGQLGFCTASALSDASASSTLYCMVSSPAPVSVGCGGGAAVVSVVVEESGL